MPQIFHPAMNTVSRVSIFGAAFFLSALVALLAIWVRSPYVTEVGVIREQPVPFSHKHHVGDVGLDCRYCHTSVEDSSFAGVPATKICMNCHSQLFVQSPLLAPVRDSYRDGKSLLWTRVHKLPDYAYFDHSIHLNKGIACVRCHGRVDQMPLMWREAPLTMLWCLDCHREPEKNIRPRDELFSMEAAARPISPDQMQRLLADYHVERRTSCSTCHR